jgi:hypothetical protein
VRLLNPDVSATATGPFVHFNRINEIEKKLLPFLKYHFSFLFPFISYVGSIFHFFFEVAADWLLNLY